jgi:hypothetical protein
MIIGVAAKARSGKDTLAKFIKEEFEEKHNRKFYDAAFAFELKNMCKFQFGLSDDQLWGDKKEDADKRFLKDKFQWVVEHFGDVDSVEYWSPREIMQEVGALYRKIDYDFWVKGLRKFLRHEKLQGHEDFIITDVRHINEARFIKSKKGFLIRIERDVENRDQIHGPAHESETGLEGYKDFDMYIDNNGDLDDLKASSYNIVNGILSIEKLIKNGRII